MSWIGEMGPSSSKYLCFRTVRHSRSKSSLASRAFKAFLRCSSYLSTSMYWKYPFTAACWRKMHQVRSCNTVKHLCYELNCIIKTWIFAVLVFRVLNRQHVSCLTEVKSFIVAHQVEAQHNQFKFTTFRLNKKKYIYPTKLRTHLVAKNHL